MLGRQQGRRAAAEEDRRHRRRSPAAQDVAGQAQLGQHGVGVAAAADAAAELGGGVGVEVAVAAARLAERDVDVDAERHAGGRRDAARAAGRRAGRITDGQGGWHRVQCACTPSARPTGADRSRAVSATARAQHALDQRPRVVVGQVGRRGQRARAPRRAAARTGRAGRRPARPGSARPSPAPATWRVDRPRSRSRVGALIGSTSTRWKARSDRRCSRTRRPCR